MSKQYTLQFSITNLFMKKCIYRYIAVRGFVLKYYILIQGFKHRKSNVPYHAYFCFFELLTLFEDVNTEVFFFLLVLYIRKVVLEEM